MQYVMRMSYSLHKFTLLSREPLKKASLRSVRMTSFSETTLPAPLPFWEITSWSAIEPIRACLSLNWVKFWSCSCENVFHCSFIRKYSSLQLFFIHTLFRVIKNTEMGELFVFPHFKVLFQCKLVWVISQKIFPQSGSQNWLDSLLKKTSNSFLRSNLYEKKPTPSKTRSRNFWGSAMAPCTSIIFAYSSSSTHGSLSDFKWGLSPTVTCKYANLF